ncbi:hypothetical protein [Plantibacter sp. M259]|uniref:hypothetical protein n=1 Tax=Plantibacter sp. M259 TaxID=2583822 RepID=UPI001110EB24|nr:hypothetical protein [Plantibacter sp. M259]
MKREQLIDLCWRGVVPVDHWYDRDSADAQKQLGEALALLRAGCEYRLTTNPKQTDQTIWVEIEYPGFNAFEDGRDDRSAWDRTLFYIPTVERLERREGKDWY